MTRVKLHPYTSTKALEDAIEAEINSGYSLVSATALTLGETASRIGRPYVILILEARR